MTIYSIKPEVALTQLVFFCMALISSLIVNNLKFDRGWIPAWFWYVSVTVLLSLTSIFGLVARGSTRWLVIFGQQIQTSELAKIGLILFSASWFAKHNQHSTVHVLRYLLAMVIPALLIYMQPDLGTTMLIAAINLCTLLVIGMPLKHLVSIGVVALMIGLPLTGHLKPYQRQRINSFINPQLDPLGAGYNSAQATIAIGSGQLIGRGLGQGTQSHLRFLPERHTDFIFSSFVEELGFVGGIVVILLYLWLCFSLLKIAKHTDSPVHSLISAITAGLLFIQAFINIGMNMGIMPITGVTLPFMSYGGSSLISMYLLLGICVGSQTMNKNAGNVFHIR